jgi:hypothetical protein
MASFSRTSLPPIVRVGNSGDAVQTTRRDTAPTSMPSQVTRVTIVRVPAPTGPALEFTPARRTVARRGRARPASTASLLDQA